MVEAPIHHEQPVSPEMPSPKYNAILVHGYWMTQRRDRTALSLRSHFAARAAAVAYDEGRGASKIVIDLGHFWGPDYPTEGVIMAQTLINKYHVPPEALIVRDEAYSTYGEVGTVLKLARENRWTKILDVAFGPHKKTIRGIYKSRDYKDLAKDVNIEQKSVEDILENDDPRITRVLRDFNAFPSRYRLRYEIYEFLKWMRMNFPGFDYKKLEQKNKEIRIEPTEDWQPPIIGDLPVLGRLLVGFDRYKLPKEEKQHTA
jgi:hypothetical protein